MFRDFFRGRYGVDTLTFVLLLTAIILSNIKYAWIIGVCLSVYALFRILSKDVDKRRKELQAFSSMTEKIRRFFVRESTGIKRVFMPIQKSIAGYQMRLKQSKHYVFFPCPGCKKPLRIPRNRGKLQVTCPVCKLVFIKKT